MSKTKRLLSVTLAIAMIILSAFSAFAEDTETVVETVGAMSVAAVSIETDDTTFDVNVKISFNEVVTGPHNIITLTCDKFNLTNVELGDVAYTYTGSEEVPDIGTVQLPQGKVTIAEDGVKNVNWATGKVLIEAPVDVNAPLVSEINLTATFTLKADVALGAGETLNIAVANDDMADASETKLSISSGASVVTVHGAGTTYGYDETNHWHACVVEGCTEHTYDVAAHTMSDYVANEDGTTETATCTDNCGYSHTKDVEVVVPTEPVVGVVDMVWNPQLDAYISLSNLVSLKDYSYQITYRLNDDYYSTLSTGTEQKMFLMVDGTNIDIELPKFVRGTYISLKQLSVARLNSDMIWRMRIEYTDADGVQHIDTSEATWTTNFVDRLTELYESENYTGTELTTVEAFIDFNTKWKETTTFNKIKFTSVPTANYGNNEVAWNSDYSTGYTNNQYISFSNFAQTVTYRFQDDIYNVLNAATGKSGKLIISSPSMSKNVEVPFEDFKRGTYVSFSQISLTKMMEDVTWQISYDYVDDNGNSQTYLSNTFTVNAYETLLNSEDELAVLFVSYATAWQAAY